MPTLNREIIFIIVINCIHSYLYYNLPTADWVSRCFIWVLFLSYPYLPSATKFECLLLLVAWFSQFVSIPKLIRKSSVSSYSPQCLYNWHFGNEAYHIAQTMRLRCIKHWVLSVDFANLIASSVVSDCIWRLFITVDRWKYCLISLISQKISFWCDLTLGNQKQYLQMTLYLHNYSSF